MPSATASGADATPNGSARSRDHNQGNQDRKYTLEQKTAVIRVRKCSATAFYEILGLEKTVSDADIKKAYRKLSLLTHPDKNGYDGADEAFKSESILNEADASCTAFYVCYFRLMFHVWMQWFREPFKCYQTRIRSQNTTSLEEIRTIALAQAQLQLHHHSAASHGLVVAVGEDQCSRMRYHRKSFLIDSLAVALVVEEAGLVLSVRCPCSILLQN